MRRMSSRGSLPSLTGLVGMDDQALDPNSFAADALSGLQILVQYYHWTFSRGLPPRKEDWNRDPRWPSPSEVERVFGSWASLNKAAGLENSRISEAIDRASEMASEALSAVEARERDLKTRLREVEKTEKDLQRRAAKQKEQITQAQELRKERDSLRRDLDTARQVSRSLEEQIGTLQTELQQLRLQAEAAPVQRRTRDGELLLTVLTQVVSPAAAQKAREIAAEWIEGGSYAYFLVDDEPGSRAAENMRAKHELALSVEQSGGIKRWEVAWRHPLPNRSSHLCGIQIFVDEGRETSQAGLRLRVGGSSSWAWKNLHPDWFPELARLWAQEELLQDGGEVLAVEPPVVTQESWEGWYHNFLTHPERRLPVLLFSDQAENLDMFQGLIGSAHVYQLERGVSFSVSEEMGREWSVWGEACRIFWPAIESEDLLSAEQAITHPLIRYDGRDMDYAFQRVVRALDDYWVGQAYPADLDLSVQAGTMSRTESRLWNQLQAEIRSREELAEENQTLHREIQQLQYEVRDLQLRLEQAPLAADAELPEPKTVLEAVRLAADRCQHLRFADAAFESAEDSPFRRPQVVLDTLLALDAVSAEYERGDTGRSMQDAAESLGLRWASSLSELTLKRYSRHYVFRFEGQEFSMGPHVALGSGSGAGKIARIYLAAHGGDDQIRRGLIVGHVGRHLPDSTT